MIREQIENWRVSAHGYQVSAEGDRLGGLWQAGFGGWGGLLLYQRAGDVGLSFEWPVGLTQLQGRGILQP